MSTTTNPLVLAWEQTCAAAPTAVVIRNADTGHACTRSELDERASAAAAGLDRTLFQRRVLFSQPNGVEWFVRFLALLRVGAVPVPIDPAERKSQQRELAASIGAAGVWLDAGIERSASVPVRDRAASLIKLTSGSTGMPRALRFTADQVLADGRQVCASMQIRPDDLNLAVIPCGHSYGLGNLVVPLLAQGTAMLIPRASLPRVLAEDCAQWRPTVFPAVPVLLRLLASAELDADALESLRTVISAGSVLPPQTAQAFSARFGRIVHGFYGSSETGGISYDREGSATLSGRSVGKPLDGVTLVSDARGRLVVESAAVYTLGNRLRSASGFGRHRPADRLRFNAEGELELGGRIGRMVKIAGRRLNLAELERAMRELDGVSDAFAQPHPTTPEELAAVLETDRPENAVRADLAARLPPWKIPRRLVLVSRFPLTARGKPDQARLRRILTRRGLSGPGDGR